MKVLFATGSVATANLCGSGADITVEPLVFSGSANPAVTLTAKQSELFCQAAAVTGPSVPTCRVLGFTGWNVCTDAGCQVFRGDVDIDTVLLEAVQTEITAEVFSHIVEETTRLLSSNDACESDDTTFVESTCVGNIVGSDDPTQVHYDVAHDVNGCWKTKQRDNNCYNYGNDILTNTFAQPGRRDFDQGTGLCKHSDRPCMQNTCEDVKKGAIADGLTWVGTELPTELPEVGHYVSLHIWPNSNFHWLRMDADKKWSHKPGGSPVKNVDNDGQTITNPATQDFSPWTQQCGYMHTVPSQIVAGPSVQVQV